MVILFGVLGAALGSFVNAWAWRIHQLSSRNLSEAQRKNLSIATGRSMCSSCGHRLAARDLVPIVSYCLLRGKCRYCKKPIPDSPLPELAGAGLAMLSLIWWPNLESSTSWLGLGIWLIIVVIGLLLAVYDLRWMLLPTRLIWGLGIVASALILVTPGEMALAERAVFAVAGSILYGGFFWLLYQISDGTWIGGGDVRLGFALGILLGWQGSIIGLTIAAYLGTACIGVLVMLRKYKKHMKLPFGPFLLTGAFVAFFWADWVVDWYLRTSGLSG